MLFRGRWLILVSKVNGTNGFQASARIEEAQSRLKQIARATATRKGIQNAIRDARPNTRTVLLLSFFYRLPLDSLETERKKWRFFYDRFSIATVQRSLRLPHSIPTSSIYTGYSI